MTSSRSEADYRRALDLFSQTVARSEGRWDAPSPCEGWTARDVVEHVIGFHEVLVLRPLGVKAHRPRDDVATRWSATADAIREALESPGSLDRELEMPGGNATTLGRLLPTLTIELVVHSWDLARAARAPEQLPRDLVDAALDRVGKNAAAMAASNMYASPITVSDDTDAQTRLLGLLGRHV